MALKQLLIQKKIDTRKKELAPLIEKRDAYTQEIEGIEKSLEEAQSEEEIGIVEEAANKVDGKKGLNEETISKLEEEIKGLEKELEEVNEKELEGSDEHNEIKERGKKMAVEKRGAKEQYFTREVIGFYEELRGKLKQRADGNVLPGNDTGATLIIPELIVDRIRERIGDFTTLFPLVDLVRAAGRVKLILDVDTSEATWIEQRGAIPQDDDSTLSAVEFDGFKIGRIVYIDNTLLEDSVINLDDYLTKRIARSIAKGLDKAILTGTGSAGKQPEGIITKIPSGNKATVTADYISIIPELAKIDTGDDAVGEIIAVMKRSTYYAKIAGLTLHVNASATDIVQLPNLSQPNFLGLRVVFSNYMGENKILFGDFDKYTLVEREGTRIEASVDYKFREDQTAIRGIGRYDGKPVMPSAFVEITLKEPAVTV